MGVFMDIASVIGLLGGLCVLGWGIYETTDPVSLFDAAFELQQRYHPDMALNLDMGSFDYCLATGSGSSQSCGVINAGQTAKLSNVLRFVRQP